MCRVIVSLALFFTEHDLLYYPKKVLHPRCFGAPARRIFPDHLITPLPILRYSVRFLRLPRRQQPASGATFEQTSLLVECS
jgi:hypothetical protein